LARLEFVLRADMMRNQMDETRTTQTEIARALIYVAPQRIALETVSLSVCAKDDFSEAQVKVRTLWSGISRGTERLVYEGKLPRSEWLRMRAPHQDGDFPFPVKYGYSAVGIVEEGPCALRQKPVFALFPHQDRFRICSDDVIVVPEPIPPRRAILAANMETALNAVWDADVHVSHNIVIIGAGVVGCLIGAILARTHKGSITLVDIDAGRADIAEAFGLGFCQPDQTPRRADIVFHTSASQAGLQLALDIARFEGRIIELSWYGDEPVSIPLGGAFHSQRLRLISSQVGHVAPSHRATWSHRARLEAALSMLDDSRFDRLITGEVAFDDLPAELSRILARGAVGLATAVRYG
jgi:2-desacetyl-2-hydroxyethyl bacteriochlorophyllide A dehydrogenase